MPTRVRVGNIRINPFSALCSVNCTGRATAILLLVGKDTIQEIMMGNYRITSGQNSGDGFYGIRLRAAAIDRAHASMCTAVRIADVITAATNRIRSMSRAIIAAPARMIAESSMASAEDRARAIIRIVDAGRHRRDTTG